MKKGIAQYPMFVYGLLILVVTLLVAMLLFSISNELEFKGKKGPEFNNLNIDLLNYIRTPVSIDSLEFLMSDLIVYSYYNKDFILLNEKTKETFNLAYSDKCFWEVSYAVDGDKVNSVSNIGETEVDVRFSEVNSVESRISLQNGKEMKIGLVKIC